MQKEADKARKRKDDSREEEETGVFYCADGSVYEGRVSRRELPVEFSLAMPMPALSASMRGQLPPELMPQITAVQHGKGVFRDTGGMTYDGSWSEGAMCGEGALQFPSGATYTGGMRGNKFSGTGTYHWPDGSRYEGQWENNKMHGFGAYVDAQGGRWVGKFYQGHGVGLLAEIHL
ncbi:central apparatus associated protein C1a-18 [Trypanosoma rangeli]|uniref:Central apparatus associated protein C1a-18 n=1 Tax=Trypanosoma rangeli TaxID=5698 RepID=A0A422NAN4_TRYRA|nr:central apparatus associated protein C1a-18 [Trypanosoma rangeli]RNF02492.1 central apparatus associated protein C1a-18 [Trypanosoma rangeli]|eukprot:RNF02492.1 central apparatus associated protein C1a-18 [Trypanosoma rangeli]